MKRDDYPEPGGGDAAPDPNPHPHKEEPTVSRLGWVTHAEAQRLLGCSRASLYRWRKAYGLRTARLGRKLFFKLSDLTNALEEHLEGSP